MLHLTIVRHGETVGKSSERLYGGTDIALSDTGISQMKCVAEHLSGSSYDIAFTSPLERSIKGADIILKKVSAPERKIIEGFTEVNFGIWEGLTMDEVKDKHPELYDEWMLSRPDFVYPGGDSKTAFRKKVSTATQEVFSTLEGKVLAVLHKGVIKVILATLLQRDILEFKKYPLELASIHTLVRNDDGWALIDANYVDHLGKFRIEASR